MIEGLWVIKLPVLIAVGAEPVAGIVTVLICKTDCDAVAGESPELFDKPVVQLPIPFASQESNNLFASRNEVRTISPSGVYRVCERDAARVTRVSRVLSSSNFLDGGRLIEGRKWWAFVHCDLVSCEFRFNEMC